MKWKRRILPESGILSDAVGYMACQLTINPVMVAKLYHNKWQIEFFFKWVKLYIISEH